MTIKPRFDYSHLHSFSLVTEHLLKYLSHSKVLLIRLSSFSRYTDARCWRRRRRRKSLLLPLPSRFKVLKTPFPLNPFLKALLPNQKP
jgi:hypothetical protein